MRSESKLGCGGCFLLVLLIFCCIGVIGTGGSFAIRNSQLYELAIESVQENPRAKDVLGTPIEAGWLVTQFSIEGDTQNSTGRIEVPVNGSKASGTVYLAVTSKNGGDWEINSAELEVDGERFSLGR